MDNQPILSLCIPTNGAVQWVLPVLDSIYSQNCDEEKIEVVLTDNGVNSELPQHLDKFQKHPSFRYIPTNDAGFLNLVTALKKGNGLFCKMINHRSILLPGIIQEWCEIINQFKEERPIIYFSDGHALGGDIIECKNIDEFLRHLSYWASWSAGIGFWASDIKKIDMIKLNEMFPNTSILFDLCPNAKFVLWNKQYQKMEDDSGKGGYDLFHTFGVVFLDMINVLRMQGRITDKTFVFIKNDLFKFLTQLYFSEVILPSCHTYMIENVADSLDVYYGRYYYMKMRFVCFVKKIKRNLKIW